MNPWDIDPDLYASLWRVLRKWYLKRKESRSVPKAHVKPVRQAGCRA